MGHSAGLTTFFFKFSALLSLIQGVVWFVVSSMAIVAYFAPPGTIKVILDHDSHEELQRAYMYYIFIKRDAASNLFIIQPNGFFIFMVLYLVLSVAWIGSSLDAIYGYRRKYEAGRMFYTLFTWVCTSIAVLVLDLIFCVLLAADYGTVLGKFSQFHTPTERLILTYYLTSYGVVMVLAAKGFFLWVLNLIASIFMLKLTLQLRVGSRFEHLSVYEILGSDQAVHIGNFPEETRNDFVRDEEDRGLSVPPGSSVDLAACDPQVERRLATCKVLTTGSTFQRLS